MNYVLSLHSVHLIKISFDTSKLKYRISIFDMQLNRFERATLNSTIYVTLVINRYRVGKRVSLPCLRFKKRISSSQKLCEIVLSISTYIRVNITTQHQTKREIDLVLNQIISTVRHHPLLDFVGNWKNKFQLPWHGFHFQLRTKYVQVGRRKFVWCKIDNCIYVDECFICRLVPTLKKVYENTFQFVQIHKGFGPTYCLLFNTIELALHIIKSLNKS